jgi:N-acyl-D-amino-acid deacylase
VREVGTVARARTTYRLFLALGIAVSLGAAGPASAQQSTLIHAATVIDGTGTPRRRADVRLKDGRVVEVGSLSRRPREAVLEANGLVLAPGFIDTHSHYDEGLFEHPEAVAAVSQGITTVVVGQDGFSSFPLADYFARLEQSPVAINLASYAGHNTMRALVLGNDFRRIATPMETAHMRALLRQEMRAGALGLSTGLEYDPGIYSDSAEVVELAREAAGYGGRYISHVRSEDRHFWPAVEEAIAIGQSTGYPVQISHLKLAMLPLWHQAPRLLARLDSARADGVNVTADVYPYTYWQSTLTVLFPERNFSDRGAAEFALTKVAAPGGLRLSQFLPDPSYVGLTLAEIATRRGTDPATTLMALIAEAEALRAQTGGEVESVIGTSMAEDDVERLLVWPQSNICTDGSIEGGHPRAYGSFPRVLGHYVRELGALPLEEAVRKMTSLAAEHMGFADRGVIAAGRRADLVLFDPGTVADRATTSNPTALAVGIARVWVNGEVVYANGRATGQFPGRVIRRETGERKAGGKGQGKNPRRQRQEQQGR